MLLNTNLHSQPWWRFGYVWLVVSGPLLVVVASVVSALFAFQGNDIDFKKEAEYVKTQIDQAPASQKQALTPAIQGRNHAASVKPSSDGHVN
jgi:hypothetical protein